MIILSTSVHVVTFIVMVVMVVVAAFGQWRRQHGAERIR